MSFENPTPLRVGATGTLGGWRVRVAGRVVMGMEIEGETYYWHEFNLVDGFGRGATLVYEETEDGAEWKLFKPFEPARALTRAEAEAKRVGESINLDGTSAEITLVDQSRVYHIDGVAPEGVEVGDVANYFNVDRGEHMLVVSWTGDEVEFYEGHDIPAANVAQAFGFQPSASAGPLTAPLHTAGDSGRRGGSSKMLKIVGVVLIGIIAFSVYSCSAGRTSQPARTAGPPPKQAAPAVRLPTGARGTLQQREYVVAQHGTIEIARVTGRHDRHEYSLATDAGQRALLINALNGNPREWHLLQPVADVPSLAAMTPYDAAAQKKGAPVALGSLRLRITDLFQSKTLSSDAHSGGAPWQPLQYGFVAQEANDWLLARWTQSGIQFHRGGTVTERDVWAALGRRQ